MIIKFCSRASASADFNNRGIEKYKLQDYKGAIADFNKSILINFRNGYAYNNRGTVKAALHDYEGAIADYNSSIIINPYFADAYLNRGVVKNTLGDKNGACFDFKKSLELGNKNAYNFVKQHCN